jgi:TolA-binding protein
MKGLRPSRSDKEGLMRRFLPALVIVVLLVSFSTGFSDMFIVYSSGDCSVDLLANDAWREAEVDMQLRMQSIVRTGPDGVLEMDLNGELISIGENRSASVGELLGKVEERKKVGFLRGLKKYTKQIGAGDEEYTEMALAGVRGSAQDEAELEWFDESDFEDGGMALDEGYRRGMDLYNAGEYTAAIDVFSNLVDEYGTDALGGAVAYQLGLSFFHVMRFGDAALYLEASIEEPDRPFYDVALMHLSVSRYFLRDYTAAIEGFVFFTEEPAADELKPYALLMLGKCHREQGENDEAARYFSMVKDTYRGTEFSESADEELASLGGS